MRAVADELANAAPEPYLVLRNIRLTAKQAAQLSDQLTQLSEELTDAGPGEARYGLLLSLYRPNQPEPESDTMVQANTIEHAPLNGATGDISGTPQAATQLGSSVRTSKRSTR